MNLGRCESRAPIIVEESLPRPIGGNGRPVAIAQMSEQHQIRAGVIDLFCGAGGLTAGLEREALHVLAGLDLDPACRFPYEKNNKARFIQSDVGHLRASELFDLWGETKTRVLVGCAPCQPFSRYTQGRTADQDDRWRLLYDFARLVAETLPDIVSMENVEALLKHHVHDEFLSHLTRLGYQIDEHVVECSAYGIPQMRRRLVLLASRIGPIRLLTPMEFGEQPRTVRDEIAGLPPLGAGEADPHDPLHRSSSLSPLNLARIRQSRPGGSWREWKAKLVAPCHRRAAGKGYASVYGRMEWHRVAPTITTQAYAFGSGRFGHPEQDRALSLREAAILQTFPPDYRFVEDGQPVAMKSVGRLIGNAVPVKLGQVIGRSIVHAMSH